MAESPSEQRAARTLVPGVLMPHGLNVVHDTVLALPAAVATEGSIVGSGVATATVVTTATTSTTTSISAVATATAVARHLVQARIDLLLGLCENLDQVTSLFRV